MGFISESTGSSSTGSCSDTSDSDLDLDEFDVTLKLGGVVSTLGDNGVWHHQFPKNDHALQKLCNSRAKMQKLIKENEKLTLKYGILFDLANSTNIQYEETEKELIQLRKIWRQAKNTTKSKSKSKRRFSNN